MAVIPRNFVSVEKLEEEIERVKQMLGPEVFRVKHRYMDNWLDEPSIYFNVVLKDSACNPETLSQVSGKIYDIFDDELRPIENWGLRVYANFRSQSEQAAREGMEPDWSE